MTGSDAVNPAVPQDDTLRLAVFMAPTTHALARLVLLVRGRGAQVLDLRWQVMPTGSEGIATLLISLERARHPHLQAAIVRSVDVKSIAVLLRNDWRTAGLVMIRAVEGVATEASEVTKTTLQLSEKPRVSCHSTDSLAP